MLASNGAEQSEPSWLLFFLLDKMCVCVNLKSILIVDTVVERVINRQSKAHESASKILFLSCHWPAAWCLCELYPHSILLFLTAKWRLCIPSWHILELLVQLSASEFFIMMLCTQLECRGAGTGWRGKCIAFGENQAQWSWLGCLELQMLQLWVHDEQGEPLSSGMCFSLHPVLAHAKRTHSRWTADLY